MIADNSTITYSYGEWAMTLDGYHIGYAPSYSEAATIINQTAYEWAMMALDVPTPPRCVSCGDLTIFDGLCAACQEWQPHAPIDVEFSPIGWA